MFPKEDPEVGRKESCEKEEEDADKTWSGQIRTWEVEKGKYMFMHYKQENKDRIIQNLTQLWQKFLCAHFETMLD